MRAVVLTGPRAAEVRDVEPPVAAAGEVVVDVERVGLCGTDVEFFTGEMAYLHMGHAAYPLSIGHEWAGTVTAVGAGVDETWLGRRVTGDTMLGCGTCHRCATGRQHVCDRRTEVGIRGGRPGALAEQLAVPASSLHALPATVDATAGAMVEPGGNALRAAEACAIEPGFRVLVLGSGTIGLLTALFARAAGALVHVAGRDPVTLDLARGLGIDEVCLMSELRPAGFDAVVDASNGAEIPQLTVDIVEPGRRVVWIGLAGEPSLVDTRTVALNDVTAVGILSASPGLARAIEAYDEGRVDPRPLVAATVGLDDAAAVLAGWRPDGAGPGPKIHVDPRR